MIPPPTRTSPHWPDAAGLRPPRPMSCRLVGVLPPDQNSPVNTQRTPWELVTGPLLTALCINKGCLSGRRRCVLLRQHCSRVCAPLRRNIWRRRHFMGAYGWRWTDFGLGLPKTEVSVSWQYASCQKWSYCLAWCGWDTVWQPVALDFLPAHWVVFQCVTCDSVWHAMASCNSPSLHNFVMEMNWTHLLFHNCHKEAPPHPVLCPCFCFLPGQLCCVCAFVPLLTTSGH